MLSMELTGDWSVRGRVFGKTIRATVPGCIHTDLLASREIPDPFYRENELEVQWVGKDDWTYSREFEATAELLAHDRVLLQCDGLDTLATIHLNGVLIGRTHNQFRRWEFDVKPHLKEGANTIEVLLESPHDAQVERAKRDGAGTHASIAHEWPGRVFIRKSQCNYGWDWGPALPTCGIWRPLRLVGFGTGRITDVEIRQKHTDGRVDLSVSVELERLNRSRLAGTVVVAHDGRIVLEAPLEIRGARGRAALRIADPLLWWPNGMGGQPLYEVTIDLVDADEELLDTATRRIGLRTLALERKKDKWGESFHFSANGKPFFAKGGNWIPADQFVTRVGEDAYKRLIHDMAAANMNMARVWGGGIYESDLFYNLCDELGICVWQDFMFACGNYPVQDDTFLAECEAEAIDNVRRLRHHPCLALWCGNNELEQMSVGPVRTDRHMSWEDYGKLFDTILPRVVRALNPDCDYWPGSPHTPHGDRANFNDPTCGDAHLWDVWHGRKPFEWYRTCEHRFNSEFGFQSFPEPKTVESYTQPGDRNVTTHVMEHHQRSGIGNAVIMQYMLDWFRLPDAFNMVLWLSQIQQGMAMKYAVEHWRRSMPRGMGTLYWQINDTWPVASWSSIDYYGRWKALHYMARHFFNPLLVSGIEDGSKGTIEVHVTNDTLAAIAGRVRWAVTTVKGESLVEDAFAVEVGERCTRKVKTLELDEVLAVYGPRNVLVWLELEVGGESMSRNLVMFARPKHMELADPGLSVSVKKETDGSFAVTLKSKAPALWTWLELSEEDATFSDNFLHLRPGAAVVVEFLPNRNLSAAEFKRQLRVCSLIDTYSAQRPVPQQQRT